MQAAGHATDPAIAAAFLTVPREIFVPGLLDEVYVDDALPTHRREGAVVSTSSQPAMMALMCAQLALEPGMRILEVGGGSGYNAAILSRLVGPQGSVVTVEFDPDLADRARANLHDAGVDNVAVFSGDGGAGHSADAPYDRIIATAACWQIPPPWLDQLSPHGRIVLPFRLNNVQLSLALKREGARLTARDLSLCRFMHLRGDYGPSFELELDDGSSLQLDCSLDQLGEFPDLLGDSRSPGRLSRPRPERGGERFLFLTLQGAPIATWVAASDRTLGQVLLLPGSALRFPSSEHESWQLWGSDASREFRADTFDRWERAGAPGPAQMKFVAQPASSDLPALPTPDGDAYRFRRGDHEYRIRFE
jgi:protein-L-isoaspartate(D-aspartate) O-methyltransferase